MTISTKRLLLRPFQPGDVDDVYAYAFHPEWRRYLWSIPEPYTRNDAKQFVSNAILEDRAQHPVFAIVMGSRVIGSVSLRADPAHGVAELRYFLGKNYWNQGIITEAATAVVDWGFHTLGLEKVFSAADARNAGGIRIMEKLGMIPEGLLRSHRFNNGERVDKVIYGILRSEWMSNAASLP